MRELKNKVYNYTEMEQMVREATCNDASDPQVSLMREIAKGTFTVEFPSIMGILWKRMKDIKTPQHPYKCATQLPPDRPWQALWPVAPCKVCA